MGAIVIPRPEQLVDIAGHVAAVKLAMDGAFDARIKDLKAATAALSDAQTIATSVSQAQKVRVDADDYSDKQRANADALMMKARDQADKAASRESTVAAREQAVASRESAADNRQATQDTREDSIIQAQSAQDAKLSARETAVRKGEIELAGALKQLAADRAALNQRLDALKV